MTVSWEELCMAPSATVGVLPIRTPVEVTSRGRVIAHVRRAIARADFPDDVEIVQVAQLRWNRDERAWGLVNGGRFIIACRQRRIALVEGVIR